MGDTTELRTVESIRDRVYIIRGQQVMLDTDLADLYGYELRFSRGGVKNSQPTKACANSI